MRVKWGNGTEHEGEVIEKTDRLLRVRLDDCSIKTIELDGSLLIKQIPSNSVKSTISDNGEKREFETGAVRDTHEGKGRCDLLPAAAILRLSKHYEAGAKKYADRNWEKGQPISVLLDSGLRHLFKYLDGYVDEDHLAAAVWNILGAMQMEVKHRELQDITTRPDNVLEWFKQTTKGEEL
jgi:hypothetical protein